MANELNATDSDTDASQLSWSILTPPSSTALIVVMVHPLTFTYQPDTNFHGSDTFSVMISDGENNDSITINLTINPVMIHRLFLEIHPNPSMKTLPSPVTSMPRILMD